MVKLKPAWRLLAVILRFLFGTIAVGHVLNFVLEIKIYFSLFRKEDPSLHWILWFVMGLLGGCVILLFGGAAIAPGGTHGKLDAWAGRPNAGWYSLSVFAMTSALFGALYFAAVCFLWGRVDGDHYMSVPLNEWTTIVFMVAILLGILGTWFIEWRMNIPDKPEPAMKGPHGKLP